MTSKLNMPSQNIAALQKQVEYFEGRRFSLDKIKDGNDAVSFHTGFENGCYIPFCASVLGIKNITIEVLTWL